MTNFFNKYWQIITAVVMAAAGVFAFVYDKGAESKMLDGRTFTSPEEKVRVVDHVIKGPTPEQQQHARIMDSINSADAIKSRAKRDSLFILMEKRLQHMDSINLLNADQVYQIKQRLNEEL